jgi:hypothetical protein
MSQSVLSNVAAITIGSYDFTGRVTTGTTSATKTVSWSDGSTSSTIVTVSGTNAIDQYFINGNPVGQNSVSTNNGRFIVGSAGANIDWNVYVWTPCAVWVPTGSVLSGGNFTVSLYNELT